MSPFTHAGVRRLIRLALEEDLGRGDVTTAATVDPTVQAVGRIVARQPVVVAGLAIVPIILDEARIREARFEAEVPGRRGRGKQPHDRRASRPRDRPAELWSA